jgi:Bacterial aa3 type cytochrome c oxidase subunit IV
LRSLRHAVKGGKSTKTTEAKLAENQDMRAASDTYTGFISLLKYGSVATALVTILVVLIIA